MYKYIHTILQRREGEVSFGQSRHKKSEYMKTITVHSIASDITMSKKTGDDSCDVGHSPRFCASVCLGTHCTSMY